MITLSADSIDVEAHRRIPQGTDTLVVFVHGSGSSRHSPRNNHVASVLGEHGYGSLLFDLLTEAEDLSRENRFDISLLTRRVEAVLESVVSDPVTKGLGVHLFGASTGAAAAIRAAVESDIAIKSVISRGGRPDLAGDALKELHTPCLLIVGGNDPQVRDINQVAADRIPGEHVLRVVKGATHLFEEPGALDEVADLAADWIGSHRG
jgi:putative phosphoribosyl transferase